MYMIECIRVLMFAILGEHMSILIMYVFATLVY